MSQEVDPSTVIDTFLNTKNQNQLEQNFISYYNLINQALDKLSTDNSPNKYSNFVQSFKIDKVIDFILEGEITNEKQMCMNTLMASLTGPLMNSLTFFTTLLEPMIWKMLKHEQEIVKMRAFSLFTKHIESSEFVHEHLEDIMELIFDYGYIALLPMLIRYYSKYAQRMQKEFGRAKKLLTGKKMLKFSHTLKQMIHL